MREIKFRAWDGGEWRIFSLEMILSEHGSWLEDHYDKWCEFTGLRDKNGKEIYEGDIVGHNEHVDAEVFYNTNVAAFGIRYGSPPIKISLNNVDLNEWEVIGNIYEGTHDSQSKD